MSYQSVVIADGPQGYWLLGELTGTTAFDASGFGRNGTYSATYQQGASTVMAYGDAGVTLAGAGYVTMGDVAAFEFTGAFSAEAWINTSSAAAGSIVGKYAATNIGWLMFMVAGGTIRFLAFTGASVSVFSIDTTASYNDGRWHHVVCTWDGTTGANKVQIYVDGVLVKQGTAAAGTPGTGVDPFVIGANASAFQNKITASLDEVAVYGLELTAAQIANHFAASKRIESSEYKLLVNSVDRSTNAFWDTVEITDVLNEAPNTASVIVEKFVPVIGQTLEIRTVSTTVFKGTITGSTQLQTRSSTRVRFRLDAMDGMYLLDRRLVNRDFVNWSATSIANNLISSFTTGFTAVNVPTSLVAVDLPNKMETVSQALSRLANLIGGFWYLDYTNDLHLRVTEALGHPQPLESARWFRYRDLAYSRKLPPTTRAIVEGQGTTTALAREPGATTLPVLDKTPFNSGGGTVISGAQQLTYTGFGTATKPTPDVWRGQTGVSAQWLSIAWSPSLRIFVAVGTNVAMSSPDGVTWTSRTPAESLIWSDVCWSPELAIFVAVGQSGTNRVMTSTNGTSWTSQSASEANAWQGVCWAAALTLFVAVSSDGTHRVMTSPDGTTWTNRTAASSLFWVKVTWSPTLSLFAAVAASTATTASIMTSPDGTTWTSRSHTSASNNDVVWADGLGLFVVASSGNFLTSSDGTTWTLGSGLTNDWRGIAWAEELGVLVAVTRDVSVTYQIALSRDGLAWTLTPSNVSTANGWRKVAWAAEIGIFAAVSDSSSSVFVITTTGQALDALVGIPASGVGSIGTAIDEGADVNLLVTRNDTGAQTVLAALEGGDGIHEAYIQDRRLSETGANNRGDAELTLGSDPEDSITVVSDDPFMISGRTLTVNVGSITSLTARIQQVQTTWPRDRKLPQRQVTATNVFKTLYQYLRDLDDRSSVD